LPFLIDTNIAIHARDGHQSVLNRFAAAADQILLSAISLAELQRGFMPVMHELRSDAPGWTCFCQR
jgi:predicted nucleic acid-binding protein